MTLVGNDKSFCCFRLTVVTKKGVEPTSPAIPAGSVFERSPEFRKLLLAKSMTQQNEFFVCVCV